VKFGISSLASKGAIAGEGRREGAMRKKGGKDFNSAGKK